jgi:hypothetical protein
MGSGEQMAQCSVWAVVSRWHNVLYGQWWADGTVFCMDSGEQMAQCSVWSVVSRWHSVLYEQWWADGSVVYGQWWADAELRTNSRRTWKMSNRGTIVIDREKTVLRYYRVTQIEIIKSPILQKLQNIFHMTQTAKKNDKSYHITIWILPE